MARPKGSTNKITKDVKEVLQDLIESVVNSIDVDSMDTNQKLKLLQLSLHYIIPKLRSVTNTGNDQDEDMPFIIDIHKRDPDTDEWVHEYVESSMPKSLVKNNADSWKK